MSTVEAQLWTAVLSTQCISVDEAWHRGTVGEDPESYQHGTSAHGRSQVSSQGPQVAV